MRRGGRSPLPLVVIGAVLLTAVVAAAVASPWEFQQRDLHGLFEPREFDQPGSDLEQPESDLVGPPVGEIRGLWDLGWVVALVQVLIAGLVLLLLLWLWRRFRHSQVAEPVRHRSIGGVMTEESEEPDLPVLAQGVAAARTHLDAQRDPGDAIVAAWLALEDAAAGAGVQRRPSQTPTEFTLAVLDRTDADHDATRRLLDLYLRARFSDLPTDPTDVEAARACLVSLAAGWQHMTAAEGDRP